MVNWDAVGAVAELLGALGVIVSLVYLAAQIRQNTRSTNAAAFHALNSSLSNVAATLLANENAARVFRVGLSDLSSLKPDEAIQFFNLLNYNFRHFESAYVQHIQGIRDEKSWAPWRNDMASYLTSSGARQWWKARRHAYHEDFRDLVNSLVDADVPPSTPPNKALQLTGHSLLQSSLVACGLRRSTTCTLPVSGLAAERPVR